MRGVPRSGGSGLVRITLLAVGALALAGCAARYSLVQPGVAGGGDYYTTEGPYPGASHGYADGIIAYDPYGGGFGYGSLYGPSFTFGLGLGSACGWSCAGYYGGWPWYYGGAGYYGWRRHRGHHDHGGPVASGPSPRPWLRTDHAPIPPSHVARGPAPPRAVPERPMEGFANRRALESTSFAPHAVPGMMRQPVSIPEGPAYTAPQPPAFAQRPIRTATPHDFARPSAPAAAPVRTAPPPARSSHAAPVKIR